MGESLAVALLSPIYPPIFSLQLAHQHHDVAIGRGGDDVVLVGGGDGVHKRVAHFVGPFQKPCLVVKSQDEPLLGAAVDRAVDNRHHGRRMLVAEATVGSPQLQRLCCRGLVAHDAVLHGLGEDALSVS